MRRKICFALLLSICMVLCLGCENKNNNDDLNSVQTGETAVNDPQAGTEGDEKILLDDDSEEAKYLRAMTSEDEYQKEHKLPEPDPDMPYSEIVRNNSPVTDEEFEEEVKNWEKARENGDLNEHTVIVSVLTKSSGASDKEIEKICEETDGELKDSYVVDDVTVLTVQVDDSIAAAKKAWNIRNVLMASPEMYMEAADEGTADTPSLSGQEEYEGEVVW